MAQHLVLGIARGGVPINHIRNNSMQGAVVGVIGSGGAAPTNWSIGTHANLTSRTIVAVGAEDGIDYIDLQLVASGAIAIEVIYDTVNPVSVRGQTWTGSSFVKLAAGSLTGVALAQRLLELGGGNLFVDTTISPTGANLSLQRWSVTRTSADAAGTNVRTRMPVNSTGAFDATLRIGWPALEQTNRARGSIARTVGVTARGPRFQVPGR